MPKLKLNLKTFVLISHDNYIAGERILAVTKISSDPIRRLIKTKREEGLVIDMTNGRRTKSAVFMDSGLIVLAPFHPESIAWRADAFNTTNRSEKQLMSRQEFQEAYYGDNTNAESV